MKKGFKKVSIFLVITLFVMTLVSFKEKQVEVENEFFSRINGTTKEEETFRESTESYYYNLKEDSDLRLLLRIYHKDKIVDTIELSNNVKNMNYSSIDGKPNYIDGTFGIIIKQDLEKGNSTFTIRLDEYTKELKINNFTLSSSQLSSKVAHSGTIPKEGIDVIKIQYDSLDEKEEKYEWTIELRFYSEKVSRSL